MNKFEIEGVITKISEPQTFSRGFTKREFVIKTDDKYPQLLKFECVKENIALLDKVQENDQVLVAFRLRGSEYNGKVFVNLQAYEISAAGYGGGGAEGERLPAEPEPEAEADGGGMPF